MASQNLETKNLFTVQILQGINKHFAFIILLTDQCYLLTGIEECLVLLKKCCGSKVNETLQGLYGCDASNNTVDKCFQRVLSN